MSKNIIITGASGNLGRATVDKLLSGKHHLIVTEPPGGSGAFSEYGDKVETHSLDLMNEEAAEALIGSLVESHGTVDAAILLVGGYAGGSIKNTTGSTLRKMFALNFETAYFVARPVFNQMILQRGGGRSILIGARPAINTEDARNNLAYSLSKSLLFRLADVLNAEGSARNVITTVVVPSTLDTPANRQAMPDADFGAWVRPEEVAEAMAWIISDKASALREPVLKMYGRV